jgi:eukaryotic-like serine/threonine-protein kinase
MMDEVPNVSKTFLHRSTVVRRDGREATLIGDFTANEAPDGLVYRYRSILDQPLLDWTERHFLIRKIGAGGQGVVFLGERRGADGFRLPVALKVFSPERYEDDPAYEEAMGRMSRVASRVAQIQQDNLLDVQNFIARDGIRVMEMEWIDGYDLRRLLTPGILSRARERVGPARWAYLNDVIVTAGAVHPRLKPGIAIAVLRDCLAALSALHREGIVHGDVKPSNIMLKRTGNAKLVDIGAAFQVDDAPEHTTCTPSYAAPEVLGGADGSARSDLASLGYTLVEMLSGAPPFAGLNRLDELKRAKWEILDRLPETLPEEVARNELLMGLITGLIAPDPDQRFPDAQAADLVELGAASFQRQLVKGDLASEYDNEIRVWLEELDDDVDPGSTDEALAREDRDSSTTSVRPASQGTTGSPA